MTGRKNKMVGVNAKNTGELKSHHDFETGKRAGSMTGTGSINHFQDREPDFRSSDRQGMSFPPKEIHIISIVYAKVSLQWKICGTNIT